VSFVERLRITLVVEKYTSFSLSNDTVSKWVIDDQNFFFICISLGLCYSKRVFRKDDSPKDGLDKDCPTIKEDLKGGFMSAFLFAQHLKTLPNQAA